MMLSTDRDDAKDRLAVALSKCARREHYGDLLDFVRDGRLGECRVYFLPPDQPHWQPHERGPRPSSHRELG